MSASFDLGFLVFLNYEHDGDAWASLEDGIGLFRLAESLGYDSGWVRVHHHARTLSAPFPFLTATALATERIRLGTAVIPIGYEDPLRFAEDAATTDLLSHGRLELGLSSGIPTGAAGDPPERARLVAERVDATLAAIRGPEVGEHDAVAAPVVSSDGSTPLPHGPVSHTDATVAYPRSPGLDRRLWYGAGSLSTALRTARQGLNLVLSTLNTEAIGPTLGHTQAEIVTRYREEFAKHHPDREPRVAVGRSILPIDNADERAEFGALKSFYDRLVTPDGRYTDSPDFSGQASPLYSGTTEQIVEQLSADPTLELVDELVLNPLSELTIAQKRRVFGTVAERVAPALGWHRANVPAR